MWRSAYSKLLNFYNSRRRLVIISAGLVILAVLSIVLLNIFVKPKPPVNTLAPIKPMPLSRAVLMVAEEQVRLAKPPPTEAAREYAYIASAYNDGLLAAGQAGGLEAAAQMLQLFYPSAWDHVSSRLHQLADIYHLKNYQPANPMPAVAQIVVSYTARNSSDGHDLPWNGIIPAGEGKWVKTTAKNPLTPRAGDWKRWVVSQPITVPPPPVVGSAEDLHQLQIVKQASANRNGDDINKINFWGGTPGTDTPSGIWQNQLYKTVYSLLPADVSSADRKYSAVQATTAQTVSDAFMECWKAKFIYWTARPDMRDPSIKTAMDDPNFPGYISGHSTISKAAADVLGVMVPSEAKSWQAMAVEARNSRLVAGIHFDIDNQVGFDVGSEVARQVIQTKNLNQTL